MSHDPAKRDELLQSIRRMTLKIAAFTVEMDDLIEGAAQLAKDLGITEYPKDDPELHAALEEAEERTTALERVLRG